MNNYFKLEELVCPHVFRKYGSFAWNFIDERLTITLNTIRDRIRKPITVNNYTIEGQLIKYMTENAYSQRGLRCCQCQIVEDKLLSNVLYMSAHILGKGADFDVEGMPAEEVREWIRVHQNALPYNIRIEKHVEWVHLDLFNNKSNLKVYEFASSLFLTNI